MSLELASPSWLATLLVLPGLIYYYRASLVDLPRRQRLVSLGVRALICGLLSLALAGLTLLAPTKNVFVVFAVDRSLSVAAESQTAAADFITQATKDAAADSFAVLPFAAQPESFTRTLSPQTQPSDAQSVASKNSNLQAAIEVAAAGMPPQFVPRIVLLSDGNETKGDALRAALQGRVRIDTVPLQPRSEPEIQVADVVVPAQVATGEPFFVEVVINSNHDDEVSVEVFKAEHRVVATRKPIRKGENRFRFSEQIDRPTEFAARVSRPLDGAGQPLVGKFNDTLLDNNMAAGLVFAAGKPRVLLIDSNPDLAQSFEWALREEGILIETRPPTGLPTDLADLQNYDVLVLSNVPATDLSQRQMEIVRTYVSELGGGFLMLGGEQSFGLGGYYKTIIEDLLPVRSDFEKEKEKPSLAMVLAIDKSGSMGGQKMELAKDAAKAAVELLSDQDQVGIIGFDTESKWVSELRPVTQKSLILDRISKVEPGGGTSLYPPMEDAFNALQNVSAKLKHVILLTDGYSAPGDFETLTKSMSSARITVSTIGIGEPDEVLLQRISEIGNGRYYFTNDPAHVPQIFAKETMTASKAALNEQPFLPQVMRSTPVLADLRFDEAPFLLGYVVTRPKATGEIILATEAGDPLLSWWRYGLGMSVAFTSDAKSRWAAEWISWPGFNKFWAQVIRHTMRKSESKGFVVNVQRHGETATVQIDAVDASGQFLNGAETKLTLIAPKLGELKLLAEQVAPGRYEAEIKTDQPGAIQVQIAQSKDGVALHQQSRGLIVGYPDELRLRPTNEDFLQALSRATGGTFNPAASDVFPNETETVSRVTPLWPYLLSVALMLFVLDVALRRMDFRLSSVRGLSARRARQPVPPTADLT